MRVVPIPIQRAAFLCSGLTKSNASTPTRGKKVTTVRVEKMSDMAVKNVETDGSRVASWASKPGKPA
jgi:hypothetical protein